MEHVPELRSCSPANVGQNSDACQDKQAVESERGEVDGASSRRMLVRLVGKPYRQGGEGERNDRTTNLSFLVVIDGVSHHGVDDQRSCEEEPRPCHNFEQRQNVPPGIAVLFTVNI